MKPISAPNTFAGLAPPWQLTQLDSNFAKVHDALNDLGTYGNVLQDTSGAPNVITVTTDPALTVTYSFGLSIQVRIKNTNTSSTVVVGVNGLGNVPVISQDGSLPVAGSLPQNAIIGLIHDGTSFQIQGIVRANLLPQTAQEQAAGVVPTNTAITTVGDPRRYGAVGGPAGAIPATDDSAAWALAVQVGYVFLPPGVAFKVVTGAAFTGKITVVGGGPTSEIYCDSEILVLTNGTGSFIDNFSMYNITVPYVITRNPSSWGTVITTASLSNSVLGYQPTVNDAELTSLIATYGSALLANINPTITTVGAASDVIISRIYGRFVYLNLKDLSNSMVCDCDFRGGRGPIVQSGPNTGGGPLGCLIFDNYSTNNGGTPGENNRALRNKVTYASFSGITMINNIRGLMEDNISSLNGESGLKTNHGDAFTSTRMTLVGNETNQNYYDGMDCQSSVPASDALALYHVINDNHSEGNGGTGINIDGKYVNCTGNTFMKNGAYGILGQGSYTKISENYLIDNNQRRGAQFHEISTGNLLNMITNNFIWMGSGANSSAIFCSPSAAHYASGNVCVGGLFFFGNPGVQLTTDLNNLDDGTGVYTDQSFVIILQNNGGVLQHILYSDINGAAFGRAYKIAGATSGAFENTPSGNDSSSDFNFGFKIGTTTPNSLICNTNPQNSSNIQMVGAIAQNSTGTPLTATATFQSLNVNGVTRNRLTFQFFNGTTGAAANLNTTTIPNGTFVKVQFYGKLA